jgi:hypothetical protein
MNKSLNFLNEQPVRMLSRTRAPNRLMNPEQHSQQAPLNNSGAMGLTTPVMRKKVEENYICIEPTNPWVGGIGTWDASARSRW